MISSCSRGLIIGAGRLGSRHLQGLSIINKNVEIIVVDPDSDALARSQKRFEEMPSNSHVSSVNYYQDIPKLDGEVDFAIIATNADVRRKVIENLLCQVQVNYLILEKVVFQSIKDFKYIMQALATRGIKAWVNCPRRIVSFFRELQKETILSASIKICVKGSNWGLASNTIHLLDLLAFLSGQTEINLNFTELDKKVYKSKRNGFIEFAGKLFVETNRGDMLELIDDRKQGIPLQMIIEFNGNRFEIDQQRGLVMTYSEYSERSDESQFHMSLQSEITAGIVEQILETGKSDLTSLNESYLLHVPMLDSFNKHLSTILNKHISICPIT